METQIGMVTQIHKVIAKAMKDEKLASELKNAAEKATGKTVDSTEMKHLISMFEIDPKAILPNSKSMVMHTTATTTITITTTTLTTIACTMTSTTTTTTTTTTN